MHHPDRRAPRLRTHVLTLALAIASPLAFADSVDELRALVDANDKTAAWDMAQRMEPENAGDPDFDFWYGLAAKAAGRKHEAVFAFERVVANQPENPRAKLELADTYYMFGNTAEAKRLFEEVLATTPPDPVQRRIRTYLGAIEAADKQRKTQVTGYVALAGGYDSNVNNATSTALHDIGPLTFALAPSSLETDSAFVDARVGLDVVQPVDSRALRFLNLSMQNRDNEDIFSGGNYDYSQFAATGGWMLRRGAATWRIPLNVQALAVESDDSRYLVTGGAEYNRPLSANTALVAYGQAGELHFPSQEQRNVYLLIAGGGYVWNAAASPFRVTLTGHLGSEPSVEQNSDLARDYGAVRVSARYGLTANQSLYGGVGTQVSVYQETDDVLGYAREETLVDATLGWQWQPSRTWNINLDALMANNASKDNDLYDYERTQVMLGTTWRF